MPLARRRGSSVGIASFVGGSIGIGNKSRRKFYSRVYGLFALLLASFSVYRTILMDLPPTATTPRTYDLVRASTPQLQTTNANPRRLLVLAAAPRSAKHVVALWTSLECFASQAHEIAIVGPTWSNSILQGFLREATTNIPRLASGTQRLSILTTVNDRYDVGLWCDGLASMGLSEANLQGSDQAMSSLSSLSSSSSSFSFDEVALLNDSVYALREYHEIFAALQRHNASMTSLNYSLIHPQGTGDAYYWLESVFRGFDALGIRTFARYSCKPADHPLFCAKAWWGQKGCIVEHFERRMAWEFPRPKTHGIFHSDVPPALLTYQDSFPSWVRHVPYWKKLVKEQGFPASKVNWKGMVDSVEDDRLATCTQYLDRSWLDGLDFSVAKSTI